MTRVRALVLTGYGLNCDMETAHAFEAAGAEARRVHINALIDREVSLDDFQIIAFGGGFSWGDDHGAGVVQAVRMKTNIGEDLLRFVENGRLVMGICNGFQTLVNLGLLPGLDGDYTARTVALINNESGNFRDDWVHLAAAPDSPCVFTRGIDKIDLPVRHGEGRFYTDPATMDRLRAGGQIVLRYALADGTPAGGKFPENPNGALDDIAGICDPTGRVFGLMPHPEAYNHPANHPAWFRKMAERRGSGGNVSERTGIAVFENAVGYFAN